MKPTIELAISGIPKQTILDIQMVLSSYQRQVPDKNQ